jgi:hypothetical protein
MSRIPIFNPTVHGSSKVGNGSPKAKSDVCVGIYVFQVLLMYSGIHHGLESKAMRSHGVLAKSWDKIEK